MAKQINQLILSPILFGREFGISLSVPYSNGIYVISCRKFNPFLSFYVFLNTFNVSKIKFIGIKL